RPETALSGRRSSIESERVRSTRELKDALVTVLEATGEERPRVTDRRELARGTAALDARGLVRQYRRDRLRERVRIARRHERADHPRSMTGSPLRGSWRPRKTILFSRSPGSTASGISTPFGITSYSPPEYVVAVLRANSETAMRRSIRSTRKPKRPPANSRHAE